MTLAPRLQGVGPASPAARGSTAELLKRVRRIELYARRLLNNQFLGEYRSVFKGRGIDFVDNREYAVGDDVRAINWPVSARMNAPYVKQFEEERQLSVYLLVDVSASAMFGSSGRSKLSVATELAALIGFAAIRNHDRVGLVAFTDRIEKYVPPRVGRQHLLRLVRELVAIEPEARTTDIAAALSFMGRVQRKTAVAFVLSDFYSESFALVLRTAARRHDLVALAITDPMELELPEAGLVRVEDAETGKAILVDAGDRGVRQRYARLASEARRLRDSQLTLANVDTIEVRTDEPPVKPLLRVLHRRARRR
jgi:uncharacterized protein (DUF58 family)